MNQRNDLLHANVDPQKYGLGDVFFDGDIYIGNEPQGFSDRAMLHVSKYVEPASALADVKHDMVVPTVFHVKVWVGLS